MKVEDGCSLPRLSRGRWIRPVEDRAVRSAASSGEGAGAGNAPGREGALSPADLAHAKGLERLLVGEVRERLAALASIERRVEERIGRLREEAEKEARELESRTRETVAALEARARAEADEARREAAKEGRARGFEEGFQRGVDEGRRLGLEEGRIEGRREGVAEGRREESERLRRASSSALAALARAARELDGARRRLIDEARQNVVRLAVKVARKMVDEAVRIEPRAVLRNVERAVDQIFRGCEATLQLHPEDARIVEDVLRAHPRWAEDLGGVEVRPASDVSRGGCRLVSGAGVVDLTLESQAEIIEGALLRAVPGSDAEGEPSTAGDVAVARDAAATGPELDLTARSLRASDREGER